MDMVNRESRTSIHFGITYILGGVAAADRTTLVEFQKALLDNELDFAQTNATAKSFSLVRTEPSNLTIRLEAIGPEVSKIQINAGNPQYELAMFIREAAAVCGAYQKTIQSRDCQIINCAAKIQHLYSCSEHAFKYIWERRLGQAAEDLACLGGRPVAGGGLRLFMPPHGVGGNDPCSIEVRLESFLREQNKLFIETTFGWPKPRLLAKDGQFDPAERLEMVERYACKEVWEFLVLKEPGR